MYLEYVKTTPGSYLILSSLGREGWDEVTGNAPKFHPTESAGLCLTPPLGNLMTGERDDRVQNTGSLFSPTRTSTFGGRPSQLPNRNSDSDPAG